MVRKSAAFGFGLLGHALPADPPPELIAALGDESRRVRITAANALQSIRLKVGVVPDLMKALESPERDVRFRAAQLLGRVGPAAEPAIPALLAILKEPADPTASEMARDHAGEWDSVCGAAVSLSQISSSQEVIARLIEVVKSGTPERQNCRRPGAGRPGAESHRCRACMIAAYDRILNSDQQETGQNEIVKSIGRIAPYSPSVIAAVAILIRALDSRDWVVRQGAAQALGNFGEDAAGARAKLRDIEQNDSEPLGHVKTAARAALAAIEGKPGDRQIGTNNDPVRLIHKGTAVERQKAALELREVADAMDIDKVITSLVGAVDDTDIVARSIAAESLSRVVHEMLRRPASTPAEQTEYDERVAAAVRALTKAPVISIRRFGHRPRSDSAFWGV